MHQSSLKVAFLGLGVMGAPMAGYLIRAGYEVCVYNRTFSKAELWTKTYGGGCAATPGEAVTDADMVFACVGNDDDLRSICLGADGAFAHMKAGSIFVDHTTVSAQVTRELCEQAAQSNIGFVDAPVSGGQAGAENGTLVIMCGGEETAFSAAEPLMETYASKIRHMGPSGSGQITKMVNQICIAGVLQGLSEALNFADKAGLDGRAVIDVINGGAAGSWQMANRHETMIDGKFDYGFAVDWMRKDLGICLQTADKIGASLPMTAQIDQYYKDVQAMGGGRWDTSALIERLRKLSA